jgi:hypothetical protein
LEWNIADNSSLVKSLQPAFTKPSWNRFLILLVGAILTVGNKTVSNILRTLGSFAREGHWTSFHKLLYLRRCHTWTLSFILSQAILQTFYKAGEPVRLAGDDTVSQHPGRRVFAKGKHRDAVRSSHSHLVFRWGHKWIVLSILVSLPWSHRLWALPIMVVLYRPKDWNKKHYKKHRTPPELMMLLLYKLVRRFPEYRFIFSGDGGFGSHELARFAYKNNRYLVLVSRFHPGANLFDLPDKRSPMGRPRKVGKKLPSPQKIVSAAKKYSKRILHWYGGEKRCVGLITGTGHWYKSGKALVFIRWVYVKDLDGTHRDEYFFTTDGNISPEQIVENYTGRWSIETTFQEARAYLGVESTRGWSEKTVLKMEPMLFLLYSVITMIYLELPQRHQKIRHINWIGKSTLSFSDIICSVRRWLWMEMVFKHPIGNGPIQKLRPKIRDTLLNALAPAA